MISARADELGLRQAPRRVVSLAPALTESLLELDCGAYLAGVSADCVFPAAEARVGPADQPDVDRVRAIAPDLVIACEDITPRASADVLAAAGLRVWWVGPRTVRQALDWLWDVISLFQAPQRAPQLDQLERAYEWAWAAAQAAEPVRLFCALGRGPAGWRTFNADTYAHDAVRLCGGQNVLASAEPRYPQVTLDEVAAGAPQAVWLWGGPGGLSAAEAELWLARPDLPTPEWVDGRWLSWPGMRLAHLLSSDLPARLSAAS